MAPRRAILLAALAAALALTSPCPATAVSGPANPASPGCAYRAAECLDFWNQHASPGAHAAAPAAVSSCDGQYPQAQADERFFWLLTYTATVEGGATQTFNCKKVVTDKRLDPFGGPVEWVNKA